MTDNNKIEDEKKLKNETSSPETSETTQDKLTKLSDEINSTTAPKKSSEKQTTKQSTQKPEVQKQTNVKPEKNMNKSSEKSLSKTAVFALILALLSGAGVGGMHYFHTLENDKQSDDLRQELTALTNQSEKRTQQLITEQKSIINQQVEQAIAEIKTASQLRIAQLEDQIIALKQNQPSDWLVHEAEYLIRIASRTIWLEHDTTAAIQLLHDADKRIEELNDPQFLPLRQIIHEDIEALKITPVLQTDETILTLLALSKQIPKLSLAMVEIPNSDEEQANLALTDDPTDWQSNLYKTWQRFLADFITIRRRVGDVEPLMSPQYQQHLTENIALKLQQAQWAASEEKEEIFKQTILDIQNWLTQYFDMGHLETAKFYQGIHSLQDVKVSYSYPQTLHSLQAIRETLSTQKESRLQQVTPEENINNSPESDEKPLNEPLPEQNNTQIKEGA